MTVPPDTQLSLLLRLQDDGDPEAWSRFVGIYTPAIYGFLRQKGLQDADAADLTQDVMASVTKSMKSFKFQPERGKFRGWLFAVVQNKLRNYWRASSKLPSARGDTQAMQLLNEQPDERNDALEIWDREYEQHLFVAAAEAVRPKVQESTWQAFWSTLVEGESPAEVALRLTMTPAAVRLAKARVLARIRREIHLIEGETS
ncbi:MAG: sigma-70 family RNA polymerase sigma factor [Planctomycetota bacterium]